MREALPFTIRLAAAVARKQRVVEDEARDVVAEGSPGDMVEAEVLPGVDAAHAGLFRRCAEARERAGYARQRGRGDREPLPVAVEAGEHIGTGGADRASGG